jgi:hypothetical protein
MSRRSPGLAPVGQGGGARPMGWSFGKMSFTRLPSRAAKVEATRPRGVEVSGARQSLRRGELSEAEPYTVDGHIEFGHYVNPMVAATAPCASAESAGLGSHPSPSVRIGTEIGIGLGSSRMPCQTSASGTCFRYDLLARHQLRQNREVRHGSDQSSRFCDCDCR